MTIYHIKSSDTPSSDTETQDIVLAVVVGCVVAFYFISFCIVGCTRHSLRMQVSIVEDKKKQRQLPGKPQKGRQSLDIATVLAQKPEGAPVPVPANKKQDKLRAETEQLTMKDTVETEQ